MTSTLSWTFKNLILVFFKCQGKKTGRQSAPQSFVSFTEEKTTMTKY